MTIGMNNTSPVITSKYWRIFQLIAFLLTVVLFIVIFPLLTDIVVVLIISLVISYVLKPGVFYLEMAGIPRIYSIIGIFMFGTAVMVLAAQFFVPMLVDEAAQLTARLEAVDFVQVYRDIVNWIDSKIPGVAPFLELRPGQSELWIDQARQAVSGYLQTSLSLFASAVNVIVLATLVPFLTFFFLKDGERFSKRLIERIPNRFFEMTLSLTHRVDRQLGRYIRSILLESLIIWILTWLAFQILGVKFALVLGLINGLLNLIPYFGPLFSYLPIGVVVMITYHPLGWGLLWMLAILISVQIIDNILLKPVLISRSVEIHPVAVLLAVLVGGRIAGAVGMFIAVPVYSIIQVIITDFYKHLKSYRII